MRWTAENLKTRLPRQCTSGCSQLHYKSAWLDSIGGPIVIGMYKFVKPERIEDILKGWIRFTQPGAFNDPFEIPAMKAAEIEERPSVFLDAVLNQTADLQEGFAANPFQVPKEAWRLPIDYLEQGREDQEPPLTDEKRTALIQESKRTIEDIDNKYGILSLSQSKDNFLL